MEPINYAIDVVNPFTSATQGLQAGWAIRDRENAERAAAIQAQQKAEQEAEMQADLANLSAKSNPTAQDYARVSTKYPHLAENFKKIWDPLNEEQKQNKISLYTQVLSAIKSGNPDIAIDTLKKQADAMRNSGDNIGADSTENLAETIRINPKMAMDTGALLLSQAMGPEKFSSVYDSLIKTPIEAENLPTKYKLENQKSFEDIETARLDRQIKVLDAKIKATDSETRRAELELKRDEKITERDSKKQEKQVAAQSTLSSISDTRTLINKILNHPTAEGGFADVGSIFRPIAALKPGSEATDFNSLLDTLKSKQWMENIKKIRSEAGAIGSITDSEGKKLEEITANINPNQSPEAFKASIKTLSDILTKAERGLVAKGELPTSNSGVGGAYIMTHPKYGVITDAVINNLLAKKPGMTREQALQFFESSGGVKPPTNPKSAGVTGAW